MADTRSTSQEVQTEILDAVRKSQEAMVDAIKRWAETIQSITPSLPVPNLPYADKLPKPEEFVANAYDFCRAAARQPARPSPRTCSRRPSR